jgi:hypothetical protein
MSDPILVWRRQFTQASMGRGKEVSCRSLKSKEPLLTTEPAVSREYLL